MNKHNSVGTYGQASEERALLVAHVAMLAAMGIGFSLIDDRSGSSSFLVVIPAPVNLPFPKGDRYVLKAA
jgi:hypothetical protein